MGWKIRTKRGAEEQDQRKSDKAHQQRKD